MVKLTAKTSMRNGAQKQNVNTQPRKHSNIFDDRLYSYITTAVVLKCCLTVGVQVPTIATVPTWDVIRPLRYSSSCKVTDFGTNQKPIGPYATSC